MSATTTENPITYTLGTVLADYELHHSEQPQVTPGDASTHSTSVGSGSISQRPAATPNPPDWPTDHRRVPPYRPVNRNLDLSERVVFQNRAEQAFINSMFFGLRMVTVGILSTQQYLQLTYLNPRNVTIL